MGSAKQFIHHAKKHKTKGFTNRNNNDIYLHDSETVVLLWLPFGPATTGSARRS
jgi:hypothetical protein